MGTSSSSQPIPTIGRRCTARSPLTLDDVLLEDGKIAPFSRTETNYVAMGRFGTVLLVGGEPDLSLARSAARSSASTSPTRPTPASSTSPCRAPG